MQQIRASDHVTQHYAVRSDYIWIMDVHVKVKNIFATMQFEGRFNLSHILSVHLDLSSKPARCSGVVLQLETPIKAHCQLYENGKATVNRGTTVEESKSFIGSFADILRETNHSCRVSTHVIVSMFVCNATYSPLYVHSKIV